MILGSQPLAIIRGGGDLATGVIYRLWKAHYRVICLETEFPLVVRRTVSVAEAIFCGFHTIEGMGARYIRHIDEWKNYHEIAVLVDPKASILNHIKPDILVDGIMAKKNLGTQKTMAPLVVALGPGFSAPQEVHAVVETKRGHSLGRVIINGSAIENTGIPGEEMGYSIERLLRSPANGYLTPLCAIGDHVDAEDIIGYIGNQKVTAQIPGVLRGLIHPSVYVTKGLKIGDIDPRDQTANCYLITDKALAIAGGVLEALLSMHKRYH